MPYKFLKRIEDLFFSLSVIIIFSPVLILVSIISFLLQGWPIFYVSKRMVGKNTQINIVKFRTMVKDELLSTGLTEMQEMDAQDV